MEGEKKKLVLITVVFIVVASSGYYLLFDYEGWDDEETPSDLSDLDPDDIVGEVTVYWFWGEGCSNCEKQKPEMDEWEKIEGVTVERFEVYHNATNQQLLQDMAEAYNIENPGVPITFVGDEYWLGFTEEKNEEMEEHLVDCLTTEGGCPHPEDRLEG